MDCGKEFECDDTRPGNTTCTFYVKDLHCRCFKCWMELNSKDKERALAAAKYCFRNDPEVIKEIVVEEL